ncbi:9304_t:CDS:1 [Scutellospora calospora]|uniref:9304_t:CDS:1 n=1 Tax=Scutellospora calospora TaxID=85575 RepID=A0ACA9P2R5_9GLOM|nr:9304_t:CDS:1 [Scutellospora calospora]
MEKKVKEYENFLEVKGVDVVYKMMMSYKNSVEKKKNQLDHVQKKFDVYKVYQEGEKKKLKDRIGELEDEICRMQLELL